MTAGLLDLLRKGADELAAPSRVVNMTALIESRGKPITDRSYPGRYRRIQALTDPFVGPPEKGSRGCVRLMADPEPATPTGGYHSSAKLKKSSKQSQDAEIQERIYAQTERELRFHP